MENDIKDWQNLWQEQKSKPLNINEMIAQLNTIEKKGKTERLVLIIATPITIIILLFVLPVFESKFYFLAVLCVAIGMIMIVLQSYKSKFKLLSKEESFSNQEFIKEKHVKLKEKIVTTSKYMWIYTALLISGINFGYLEIFKDFSMPFRVGMHISFSVILFVLMYIGIKVKLKQNTKEIEPLIQKLEALQQD